MIRNADKFKVLYSGFINRVHAICTGSHFKDVRRNILFISDLYHCCAFLPFLHCDCRCTHISPRERLLVHSPVQTRHGRMQCPFPLLNGLYRWVFCPVIRTQQQIGRFNLRHDPSADKDCASALLLGYQADQYVYQYMQAMFKSQ